MVFSDERYKKDAAKTGNSYWNLSRAGIKDALILIYAKKPRKALFDRARFSMHLNWAVSAVVGQITGEISLPSIRMTKKICTVKFARKAQGVFDIVTYTRGIGCVRSAHFNKDSASLRHSLANVKSLYLHSRDLSFIPRGISTCRAWQTSFAFPRNES